MTETLSRWWHDPRIGPLMFAPLAIAALVLAVVLVVSPFTIGSAAIKAYVFDDPAALQRYSTGYLLFVVGAWMIVIGLMVQLRLIARANSGLSMQVEIDLAALRAAGSRPAVSSETDVARRLRGLMAQRRAFAGAEIGDIIREDYGSGFWINSGSESYWISVGSTDPEEDSENLFIGLDYDAGFSIRRLLSHRSDPRRFARVSEELRAAIAELGLFRPAGNGSSGSG
jgi:hypothetical protein